MSSTSSSALEALRTRFAAAELVELAPQPYPAVLRQMRERRAAARVESRLVETPESARETPVIRAFHAFCVEQEPAVELVPWDGELC